MPSSSLFLRSSTAFATVLSLLAASTNAFTSNKYELETTYAGDTFFDGFDFFTDADPSHGFVTYVDEDTAKSTGLIKFGSDGSVIIGVDSTHIYNASQPYYLINGVGRPSVRITSTQKYNHGLFIADIAHMPGGVCGTWPAFWTLGDGTWPDHGEIDILEGANDQTTDLTSLHTAKVCSIAGDSRTETGILQATNCTYDVATGANSAGCSVSSTDSDSYGLGFNSDQGGVYAMQWTSDYIKIWFWPRGSIPKDIEAGAPTPDAWGLPTTDFQGDCDIDSNFINHQIVLDVTFCGDLAGANWNNSCAASTGVSTCAAFVADTPSAFTNMYWDINSIKVYQLVPPTSTTTSATTPHSTAWSTWGSESTGVTYSGSWTTSFSLTTASAHSSILAPPLGGDGYDGGTISVDGTAWAWGSATSTGPASKTPTTWGSTSTTTWGSWSDPTSSSTATWASWTAASTTAPSTLTKSVGYNAAGTSAWAPPNATTAGPQLATFTGTASSVSMSAMGYVAAAVAGLVIVMM